MRAIDWMKNETMRVVPVFIFFLFFFTIINWTEVYLYKQVGIKPFHFLEIAIAASLIAKIILVIDHVPIIDFVKKKPLIFGIFWKTAVYWIVLLFVRLLIRLVPFLFHQESFEVEFDTFLETINWNLFISIQTYYLMLLFIFVTFRELTLKIGVKKMQRLFFQ